MPNKERLLLLAAHIVSDKIGHETFDFDRYNGGKENEIGCGTSGCAIGECPILWPDSWQFGIFGMGGSPRLLTEVRSTWEQPVSMTSGMEWFDLTEYEYRFLFMPRGERNFEGLPCYATAKDVADRIISFCDAIQ